MENVLDYRGDVTVDVGVEHTGEFDLRKEVFLLVEQQKEKIINYLQSKEAQAKVANYINKYAPGSVNNKTVLEEAIRRAVENIDHLKCKVAPIKDNNPLGITLGAFDHKTNTITVNNSHLDSSGNLVRYNAETFAQNKEEILLTVVHELRHATRLDASQASEEIIIHNFDRKLGLQNILAHMDQVSNALLEKKIHDTQQEMEAQNIDATTIQKMLDEIRASASYDRGVIRIATKSKYESEVMSPIELYARAKELETYMISRKLDFTKENIVLLTQEVKSGETDFFGGYEQLLIMCQGQEEGLVTILHDLVDGMGKNSQYKNVA